MTSNDRSKKRKTNNINKALLYDYIYGLLNKISGPPFSATEGETP